MSLSFRPVNEVWGEHSSCFVDTDLMLRVLHKLAKLSGTSSEACEYGDKTSVWIEDGTRFLDHTSSEISCTVAHIACGLKLGRNQLNRLKFLVSNMRILADSWRSSIDAHGALMFYIDAY